MYTAWPHGPSHLFQAGHTYFVTAGTYGKRKVFDTPDRRDHLLRTIFSEAMRYNWLLEAWAVFANHYHIVAVAPEDPRSLSLFLRTVHSKTALWVNAQDATSGRKVWFQYRDTCLTYERSYLARLHYVHRNPEQHGMAKDAENYPWCSMAWFARNAPRSYVNTVLSFKTDKLKVEDDF
jgi:putative transposase